MIYLKAYLENNLGDDLFVHIITERYPHTRFIITAPNEYKEIYKDRKNLVIISKKNLIYRAISRFFRKYIQKLSVERLINFFCRGAVYIGGSIFIQPPEDKYEKSLRSFYYTINKNFTAVIGCNFGPFSDKKFLNDYRTAFQKVSDICFRDKSSYELFKELKNTRYAPDAVFCLKNIPHTAQTKSVFISVINLSNRLELSHLQQAYESKIIDAVNMFSADGYTVKLVSFCRAEGDETTVSSIMDDTHLRYRSAVSPLYYRGNLSEIINAAAESEIVIATRFHAMIIGLLFGKKTFPIIYSDKMTAALDCCGIDIEYIKIDDIDELSCDKLKNVLDNYRVPDLKNIIRDADRQFEATDKFLDE